MPRPLGPSPFTEHQPRRRGRRRRRKRRRRKKRRPIRMCQQCWRSVATQRQMGTHTPDVQTHARTHSHTHGHTHTQSRPLTRITHPSYTPRRDGDESQRLPGFCTGVFFSLSLSLSPLTNCLFWEGTEFLLGFSLSLSLHWIRSTSRAWNREPSSMLTRESL